MAIHVLSSLSLGEVEVQLPAVQLIAMNIADSLLSALWLFVVHVRLSPHVNIDNHLHDVHLLLHD